MIIFHNLVAMNAQRQYKIDTDRKAKRTERLSSGFKINKAADDAAGLSISEKMRRQINGLAQGIENIREGIGYCQVADGALHEVEDMLHRMDELAIQAANGTNSDSDRESIDLEVQHLKTEMDRIYETTKFNEEYLFKCDESRGSTRKEPYKLSFSGYPNDLYIYNETYDAAAGAVTYGGIAYKGKRYAWAGISPTMYDSATNTFREGTYRLRADDGSCLTLSCKGGDEPPQVTREFWTSADEKGIYVNDELIAWEHVKTASGHAIGRENGLKTEPYYFQYHGVTVSFTPEAKDNFASVVSKLTGTNWKSSYRIPTEKEALYTDFSKAYAAFANGTEVKDYLAGSADFLPDDYIIRAGDGSNGTFDGIWLEQNGVLVTDSEKSWADVGISNWGNQSTDIWFDKTFQYTYGPAGGGANFTFSFQVINEISKDSMIDALDGVQVTESRSVSVSNHAGLTMNTQNTGVVGGQIIRDSVKFTLAEEYALGRDYTSTEDTFGSEGLVYDGTSFSAEYTSTVDGTTTTKKYTNTTAETDRIQNAIRNDIKKDMNDYLKIIAARYLAGAAKPNDINLAALVTPNLITGGGSSTYFEDVLTFDPADPALKSTLGMNGKTSYAGAGIDFSGLGTSYQIADLIGMGFNTTCQTCENHYSIQFTTQDLVSANWNTMQAADGNTYRYCYAKDGLNHTLYIDALSMIGKINDGVAFTNTVVDIIDRAGYDFHYSQYATYDNGSTLYVFDNRPKYVENNVSVAKKASFSPFAYGINTISEYTVNLYATDTAAQSVGIKYEYDYGDLFRPDKLQFTYQQDTNGGFVQSQPGTYERYDPANPAHAGLDRYSIKDVSLDTQGKDLDTYLNEYIRNTVFQETAQSSTVELISDYARFRINGQANENKAIITEYNTPHQILPLDTSGIHNDGWLRIQCSANALDHIYIPKQKMSVYRMGLEQAEVKTEETARQTIALLDYALTKVSAVRSKFGAYQNRLEHALDNAGNVAENTTAAESRIRDADMADEMVAYSLANILAQAGEAVLSQANMSKQGVLTLLQSL